MIIVGIDPHKRTHTAVAIDARTGEALGELTVAARPRGHERLVRWALRLGGDLRVAVEDCRHVSGGLERLLLERGVHVVRVPPKLMGRSTKAGPWEASAIWPASAFIQARIWVRTARAAWW